MLTFCNIAPIIAGNLSFLTTHLFPRFQPYAIIGPKTDDMKPVTCALDGREQAGAVITGGTAVENTGV